MSTRTRRTIGEFIEIFGSAVAAASAVERGRQPAARDLRTLGIDPEQFRRIGQ
ncbi:hypothetical protein [Mesorhizobium sp. CN2-181]|uniref:hypothetical protein n=1 Tax=Mesorhizobium yinganensis TaxID=3157707 RepID=UPI0032B7B2CC